MLECVIDTYGTQMRRLRINNNVACTNVHLTPRQCFVASDCRRLHNSDSASFCKTWPSAQNHPQSWTRQPGTTLPWVLNPEPVPHLLVHPLDVGLPVLAACSQGAGGAHHHQATARPSDGHVETSRVGHKANGAALIAPDEHGCQHIVVSPCFKDVSRMQGWASSPLRLPRAR